jgi:hypothetical protein
MQTTDTTHRQQVLADLLPHASELDRKWLARNIGGTTFDVLARALRQTKPTTTEN